MATYGHIIFYSLLGGLFSLAAGVLLLSRKNLAKKLAIYATPFAAGALLAAVFLDLLKEGVEQASTDTVMVSALAGILVFFLAERFLRWFHHHHEHKDKQPDPSTALIIAGDTLHNAMDGVAIAAAFLVSVPTGIVTTFAVAAHELPQEVGDFGLLLSKGMARRKVLLVNIVSALATTILAVITFRLGSQDALPVGALLGLSAGFLLYIALSDVIPTIHERAPKKRLVELQTMLLILGVAVVGLAINVSHQYIHEDYHHETGTHTHVHDEHEDHEHHEDEHHEEDHRHTDEH